MSETAWWPLWGIPTYYIHIYCIYTVYYLGKFYGYSHGLNFLADHVAVLVYFPLDQFRVRVWDVHIVGVWERSLCVSWDMVLFCVFHVFTYSHRTHTVKREADIRIQVQLWRGRGRLRLPQKSKRTFVSN